MKVKYKLGISILRNQVYSNGWQFLIMDQLNAILLKQGHRILPCNQADCLTTNVGLNDFVWKLISAAGLLSLRSISFTLSRPIS
jgi:hypothetical protein